MKNIERRALKDAQLGRPRIRLVLGSRGVYEKCLRQFLYTPATARRLNNPGQLHGVTPSNVFVVLLPGWREEARHIMGLFSDVMEWRSLWRWTGFEEIEALELEGGIPVRSENLLKHYDKLLEGCGTNSIANEVARDWLNSLDENDGQILLAAYERRKSAEKAVEKKS